MLLNTTRILFFTGKGGVGKTSLACATALALAEDHDKRVLLVSTDPASNLDEVLDVPLDGTPKEVPGTNARLFALNIDPEAAARAYRERVVGPYRDLLPEAAIASMEEQLSGACTVEIASFDEFTKLLGDPAATAGFDHIVFDTAPTGHTLRLLQLPAAWTGFMNNNTTGTSCLGPLSGLAAQKLLYEESLRALADPQRTTLYLVSRPEPSALREAERSRRELAALGLANQHLFLNAVFTAVDPHDDPAAAALEARGRRAIADMPEPLSHLPRTDFPLLARAPMGLAGLRSIFKPEAPPPSPAPEPTTAPNTAATLQDLIDDLESATNRGVILTMGKGGVGKTTIAAAIAVELAARGHQVHLSTTDPAAHIADVAGDTPGLTVHRIDPKLETARYTQEVLDTAGAGLTPEGRALLEEDLRSPCTEEIAVFRAFAQTVEIGASGFVVLDTAPTGHTLLLLDAAEAYHREVLRTQSAMPDAVRNLLPRLRDAAYTKVLIVTLPEATPVHEAARLQQDLHRAGIPTHAWIINQSFSAASHTFRDPVLAERGRREIPFLCEVREKLASQVITVPWTPDPPVGPEKLRQLVASPQPDPGKRIEQLMPKLRAFLSKRISNPADVDDLAQDVLLRVHQSAGQLTDETRMHAWIWQIARNAVIDHYRHGSKRPAIVDLRELDLPPVQEDRRPDVEEIVTSWLAPMVEDLPETYREAVRLSEIEGLPHAEIAARLSLSVSGVKSRVQRGRAKLREAMLACCQFEFDRDGRIVGFRRNAPDCVAGVC